MAACPQATSNIPMIACRDVSEIEHELNIERRIHEHKNKLIPGSRQGTT
jgi:hypothetical protein